MNKEKSKTKGGFRYTPSGKIEYRFCYTDLEGARRTKSFCAESEAECIKRANEFMRLQSLGLEPERKKSRTIKPRWEGQMYFTKGEENSFVDTIDKYNSAGAPFKYQLQFLTVLYTGMSMCEVNALTAGDIDFDAGEIRVSGVITFDKNKKPVYKRYTQQDVGYRSIPMAEKLKPVLQQAISEMNQNTYDLLFYNNEKDCVIDASYTNNSFNAICKASGLHCSRQKVLRYTFARRCLDDGMEKATIKGMMGRINLDCIE